MTVENLLCGWYVVANIRKNNQYMDLVSDTGLSLPRHIIITQRERERFQVSNNLLSLSVFHMCQWERISHRFPCPFADELP
jgi:hypothetical protein